MKKRKYNIPVYIDNEYFESVISGHDYLMQIDGRVRLEMLERFIRTGRRTIHGHRIIKANKIGVIQPFNN